MNTDKTLLSVAVTLVILGSIFFVIERVFGRGRNRSQPIIRKGWITDVVYWFTTILLTRPFVRLMLILPLSVLILAKVTSLWKRGTMQTVRCILNMTAAATGLPNSARPADIQSNP